MSEFIGSRISLISKSDIRYVGTLHEINSEDSTVALENVRSYGTEGRLGRPDDEIAPSDGLYEYIVFRGSDVKDLRIEEGPAEPTQAPQVPNDPAILSGSRRDAQNIPPQQNFQQRPNQGPQFQPPPHFQPYQQFGPPPNQRFGGPNGGPQPGFPGPPPGNFQHYPGGPYGPPPPGWYPPPPHQGFNPPPGPFSPSHNHQVPQGSPGQNVQMPPKPNQSQAANGPPASQNQKPASAQSSSAADGKAAAQGKPNQAQPSTAGKADATLVEAPGAAVAASKPTSRGPASKVALPMANVAAKNVAKAPQGNPAAPPSGPKATSQAAASAAQQYQDATRAATAAVAAAMAKLPPASGGAAQTQQGNRSSGIDNLTQKVNEMRVDDRIRNSRAPGTGGYAAAARGRGSFPRGRGGREPQGKGLEVPNTDFDFESANAKFNKQDLVKEVIASGEPVVAAANLPGANGAINGDGAKDDEEVVIPPPQPSYNKSSFFDNISSELKDRAESGSGDNRAGGREFRNEERKRNMETFGLGSVDGGSYRGNFRGRGRGRGFRGGFRGDRGGSARGRGGAGGVEA